MDTHDRDEEDVPVENDRQKAAIEEFQQVVRATG